MPDCKYGQPVDYVDPNIGTIGHLLTATSPTVALPHGMMQIAPTTTPGITDRYLADKIYGFPVGPILISATSGQGPADADQCASVFDHDLETASPHYYSVLLEDFEILAEYTVAAHSAYFRLTYPMGVKPAVVLRTHRDGEFTLLNDGCIAARGRHNGIDSYVRLEFSERFASHSLWKDGQSADNSRLGFYADFDDGVRCLEIRASLSYVSQDQAKASLDAEVPARSFDAVKERARKAWDEALGRLDIDGGSNEQRTIFYTALYRSLLRMVNITEGGRYYRGYDGQVHETNGSDHYVNDALWDTHRCMHPLQLLLDPNRQTDMAASYIRMYEQSGWLPTFPGFGAERPVMLGNHVAAFIADTYFKGCRRFDVEKAYEGIRKNAMEATKLPWRRGPVTELDRVYLEKGFFPSLAPGEEESVSEVHSFERRQAVSVTLEHSYDDGCLARLAKALGKEEDHSLFSARARNYENLFDGRIGFMAPKTADGRWVDEFDPKRGGGQGGRAYFAECNSWVYSFSVQHDIPGLIGLMGGRERFAEKLDSLFVEQYDVAKYDFLKQFPDATGLIGQYPQGNEPSFHIPYLYNYAGQPWKTQRRLREIMKLWYTASPLGICGDEDGGAMSSWYVFNAMGFYPVCPGQPIYNIGSPLFAKTRLKLSDGGCFTIAALNVSDKNKYIQSAQLNGVPLDRPWFAHSDIKSGGSLVLEMGVRPNKAWGSAPEAAPPPLNG